MLRRGPSGTAHGGYRVAGLHTVSHADQVLGIVTVTSLQPVGMTHYHHVPVCGILSGEADYPVEHRPYLVARLRFQVRSRMVLACPAIGADHLGTGQRITPLPYPGQVYRERRSLVEQPRCGHAYMLPFHGRERAVQVHQFRHPEPVETGRTFDNLSPPAERSTDITGLVQTKLHGIELQTTIGTSQRGRAHRHAVHHQGEISIDHAMVRTGQRDRLPGRNIIAGLHQRLGVMGIHRFHPVGMKHHDRLS